MIRFAPRTRSIAEIRALIRADPRVRLAAFVIATGLISAIALLFSPPAVVSYGQAGVVADREVRAPHSTAFTSETLTQAERDKAAAAVQRVYVADPAVNVTASSHLQAALTGIARIRNDATQTRDQRIAALTKLTEVALSTALATDALDMTAAEWDQLNRELDPALKTLYGQGIRPDQRAHLRDRSGPRREPDHSGFLSYRSYARTIRATSSWRTTSRSSKSTNEMPSTPRSASRATTMPDF